MSHIAEYTVQGDADGVQHAGEDAAAAADGVQHAGEDAADAADGLQHAGEDAADAVRHAGEDAVDGVQHEDHAGSAHNTRLRDDDEAYLQQENVPAHLVCCTCCLHLSAAAFGSTCCQHWFAAQLWLHVLASLLGSTSFLSLQVLEIVPSELLPESDARRLMAGGEASDTDGDVRELESLAGSS